MNSSERKHAVERIGEECTHCGWTLTVEEVIRREQENHSRMPSARRISSKFASLGEGHAYFNRGHRVIRVMTTDEIKQYIQKYD